MTEDEAKNLLGHRVMVRPGCSVKHRVGSVGEVISTLWTPFGYNVEIKFKDPPNIYIERLSSIRDEGINEVGNQT